MPDTTCSRAWDNININIGSWEYKVCCLTGWRPLDEDRWWDAPEVVDRRRAMLSGDWHPDCGACMEVEAAGGISDRRLWGLDRGPGEPGSAFDDGCQLVINLGNTCDMACRYCGPQASSVWAARMGEHARPDDQPGRMARLYAWVRGNRGRFSMIRFGGGEPSLCEELYSTVGSIDPRDALVAIDTNLNAVPSWAGRFASLVDGLIDAGNRVELRYSLDGTGAMQEWQRQGASWERQVRNFIELGSRDLTFELALTVTPMTLEGMCDAIEWSMAMSPRLRNRPRWTSASMVRNLFPAAPWFGEYGEEISRAIALLGDDAIDGADLARQMGSWLSQARAPTDAERRSLSMELDLSVSRWGGGGWRDVYPKLARLLSDIPGHPV